MKNKKQAKVGSLVKIRSDFEGDTRMVGLYGVVCEIRDQPLSGRMPPQRALLHHIHLQNGDKYLAWAEEFEVLA